MIRLKIFEQVHAYEILLWDTVLKYTEILNKCGSYKSSILKLSKFFAV